MNAAFTGIEVTPNTIKVRKHMPAVHYETEGNKILVPVPESRVNYILREIHDTVIRPLGMTYGVRATAIIQGKEERP